ncbi:MAG TPA: DegV family protein [Coriobacteriia bacterium]
MSPFPAPLLITDSSCDLPTEVLDGLGVEVLHLGFSIGDEHHVDDLGASMSHASFYDLMRGDAAPTTSAIPIGDYVAAFERAGAAGRPVLLLGLSSALSSSYEAALAARDMVIAKRPHSDIRIVDSLNASLALGLLVYLAAGRIAAGADIDALEGWVLEARTGVNGYFTLESLEHLRRGGRISDVAAFAGTMLDVRPVLRIDAHGQLVFAGQARGRRKSMKALVDVIEQRVIAPEGQTIFVAHGDAGADAELLEAMVRERVPFADVVLAEIGPVIGSHVGPGMLAVVFVGRDRLS